MKIFTAFAFLIFITCAASAQSPDLILYNGNIFTSDSSMPYVRALAIKKGVIFSTGADKDILKLAGAKTRKINLKGKTVVPGFNDAHDHPGAFIGGRGYVYLEKQISGLAPEAVLDSVSRIAKMCRPGEWINGLIGQAVLTDLDFRRKLDSVAPDNPVFLFAWWGHGAVFNSKALMLAGIKDTDKDPVGGWYERDPATGKINTLKEYAGWNAAETYYSSIPESIKVAGLKNYTDLQIQYGITSTQFMTTFSMLPAIIKENPAIRTRIIPFIKTSERSRNLEIWNKLPRNTAPLVYVSGIKYVIDGTPYDESSFSTKPYADKPGWNGRLDFEPDTIRQILKDALYGERQLVMHVVGDSSLNLLLSWMKSLGSNADWQSKRVRLEHNSGYGANLAAQMDEIKDLNLLMMHTPMYVRQSPLKSLIKKGIKVGIAPDGLTNPFVNIMIVTSQQADPNENITREEAVIAYTKNNAYAEFAEGVKGTLTKGKVADLAVLSQNIFTILTEQLPGTKSLLTMVGGKIIYLSKEMDLH